MSEFMQWLAMGGYSSYVWSAYLLVFVVLVANGLAIKGQRIRIHKKLQQWIKRQSQ